MIYFYSIKEITFKNFFDISIGYETVDCFIQWGILSFLLTEKKKIKIRNVATFFLTESLPEAEGVEEVKQTRPTIDNKKSIEFYLTYKFQLAYYLHLSINEIDNMNFRHALYFLDLIRYQKEIENSTGERTPVKPSYVERFLKDKTAITKTSFEGYF